MNDIIGEPFDELSDRVHIHRHGDSRTTVAHERHGHPVHAVDDVWLVLGLDVLHLFVETAVAVFSKGVEVADQRGVGRTFQEVDAVTQRLLLSVLAPVDASKPQNHDTLDDAYLQGGHTERHEGKRRMAR